MNNNQTRINPTVYAVRAAHGICRILQPAAMAAFHQKTVDSLAHKADPLPPFLLRLILAMKYLIMFTPLLFGGAGKWSLDYASVRYGQKLGNS